MNHIKRQILYKKGDFSLIQISSENFHLFLYGDYTDRDLNFIKKKTGTLTLGESCQSY